MDPIERVDIHRIDGDVVSHFDADDEAEIDGVDDGKGNPDDAATSAKNKTIGELTRSKSASRRTLTRLGYLGLKNKAIKKEKETEERSITLKPDKVSSKQCIAHLEHQLGEKNENISRLSSQYKRIVAHFISMGKPLQPDPSDLSPPEKPVPNQQDLSELALKAFLKVGTLSNSSKQLMADIVAQLNAKKLELSRIGNQFDITKDNLRAIMNSMPSDPPRALFPPKKRKHQQALRKTSLKSPSTGSTLNDSEKYDECSSSTVIIHACERARQCKLQIGGQANIVATGRVHFLGEHVPLHGLRLPDDCYRVSVDVVLKGSAFLPIKCCDMVLVEDVLGCVVPWPKNQVIFASGETEIQWSRRLKNNTVGGM